MKNLKIFCTSIKYYKVLDKLPNYIKKIGLGSKNFPSNWFNDSSGVNISHLNKYYGELTGIYWIWKNHLKNLNKNDLIGNCHYRKLWLNNCYNNKQKKSFKSLFDNLLNNNNSLILQNKTIQVQPIKFKKKIYLRILKIFIKIKF